MIDKVSRFNFIPLLKLSIETDFGRSYYNKMLKYLYLVLGLISLALGLLGIVTPGLPTTPFILLTAFLFAKSSPKLHQKLLDHKVTGRYIKKVNTGLSLKARLISISLMWCMVCFTTFVVFDNWHYRYIMLGLGIIGTIAQLIILKKRKAQVAVSDVENEYTSKENN